MLACQSASRPATIRASLSGWAAMTNVSPDGPGPIRAHANDESMRGFWPALLVNVVVGGLLAWGVWTLGIMAGDVAEFHGRHTHNLAVAALAALLACTLDTFFQGKLYGKTGKGSGRHAVVMLVLLLVVLLAGAYVAVRTNPDILEVFSSVEEAIPTK